jgi:LysM repeat protein
VKFSVLAVLCPILFFPAALSAQESLTVATAAEYEEGLIHTVVKGDTLWDLSAKYLGSPWVWPELWERNRFLTNPHYIYPGIKIVVYPPPPREYVMEIREPAREAVPAAAEPSEEVAAQPEGAAPSVDAPSERPTLVISPEDFVRAGEFTPERPAGIGYIRGGEQDKIAFSEEDKVILGVYRVRGPVRSQAGRPVSGYVRFLVGILQVTGKQEGQVTAVVRKSFADLSREDLIREEIPSYSPVYFREGASGIEAFVITGRYPKKALATDDFVYLDRGADAGVAVGDVFRLYDRRGEALSDWDKGMANVPIPVGNAVIVRVLPGSATAYVTSTTQSFPAGAIARSGPAESP